MMGDDMDRLPDITLDTVERLARSWDSGHGSLVLRIVAEDRRLRVEIERLRALERGANATAHDLSKQNDSLEAEVERLQKVVQDDDAIIDELRCDCAKLETEVERLKALTERWGEEISLWWEVTGKGTPREAKVEVKRLQKEVAQVRHDAFKEGYQTRAEEERENP